MDLRSKGLEPTVGCVFRIENFGYENATPPLKTQYGKECSSKISGTVFFCFCASFSEKRAISFSQSYLVVRKKSRVEICFPKKRHKRKKTSTTNFTRPFFSVLCFQGRCCVLERKILNFENTAHCGFKVC